METLLVPSFGSGNDIIEFGQKLLSEDQVALDFSKIGFAKPPGMILLSQFISAAVREGRVQGFWGAEPCGYPANMGFFECCGLDVPRYASPGGENYLPLEAIDLEEWRGQANKSGVPFGKLADQRVGRMAYLITRDWRGDLFELIKYCLREIVRNALEHGNGQRMWVSGQYWPQLHEVELCIFDDGIGIRNGIVQNEMFSGIKSDRDAIRLAILPSTSGKKVYGSEEEIQFEDGTGEWGNSGFGLFVTSQLARNSGFFVIGSGSSYQQISGNESKKGDFGLSGTYIAMHFDVEGLRRTAAQVNEIVQKGESFARRHFALGAEVMASAASKIIIS